MPNSFHNEQNAIISIENLSRHFGTKAALKNVSLSIPRGGVFGLIGGNGAGKTTLLKHMLGLLAAQSGSVRVFGLDPVKEPEKTLGRIGYLSENRDLPDWMRIHELIRYSQAFYPQWDSIYAEELREMFDLDPVARVRNLSRGQRARAGLLVALAHRPDLLVLDEPSSGLDPVVRRDILGAIIRTIADEGRTVVFSSHLLDEVERVSDNIAIIHEGNVLLSSPIEDLKTSHRRLTLRFDTPTENPPSLVGEIARSGAGHEWNYVCAGDPQQIKKAAEAIGASVVEDAHLSLDEIFVSRVTSVSRGQMTAIAPFQN